MSFLELAKARYSVRKFSDKPVEREKLDIVLEAGRVAPTACNYQPQRILVLNTPEGVARMAKCTRFTFGAPVCLLVCVDERESWKREFDGADSGEIDASIVTTHMTLAAHEVGLGSTWVMYFEPALVKEEFNLPDYLIPVAVLPMGYPAENARPAPGHSQIKEIEETVFYGDFTNTEK